MYEHTWGAYRWDTGPSVITMRHVFEELFSVAGRRMEDYLKLEPLEPLTRYFYTDGTQFDASSNLAAMVQSITRLEERDVEGYLSYLAYAARIHRITGPVFIYDRPPRLASFARVPVTQWLSADPLRTMQQAINSHVKSPKLRQLLGRFATYVGGSPFLAPATLNVIAHVELAGGVWYPRGGVYQIARALAALAAEIGVTIHTDTPVKRLQVEGGRAIGVVTQAGALFAADATISNADVTTTLNTLVDTNVQDMAHLTRLKTYEPSCSGFIMMLAVARQFPQLAHHNIFFSGDYRAEFDAIFQQQVPPPSPTVYVSITSKTDISHAPEGHENWFVLVNAPALSAAYNWRAQAESYKETVYRQLGMFGLDVRPYVQHEVIWSPLDLQQHSGAWRGALYGPSANSRFTVFRRPQNRSTSIRDLYFAGGTTHPGGGVPMVALSGKVAADFVIQDHP
jgi:phytoene desaturase